MTEHLVTLDEGYEIMNLRVGGRFLKSKEIVQRRNKGKSYPHLNVRGVEYYLSRVNGNRLTICEFRGSLKLEKSKLREDDRFGFYATSAVPFQTYLHLEKKGEITFSDKEIKKYAIDTSNRFELELEDSQAPRSYSVPILKHPEEAKFIFGLEQDYDQFTKVLGRSPEVMVLSSGKKDETVWYLTNIGFIRISGKNSRNHIAILRRSHKNAYYSRFDLFSEEHVVFDFDDDTGMSLEGRLIHQAGNPLVKHEGITIMNNDRLPQYVRRRLGF